MWLLFLSFLSSEFFHLCCTIFISASTCVHHLKWSCIKTGSGLYLGPDLPLSWSRLASIMVRKADSKMVLSAKGNYVQNYINFASNGVKFLSFIFTYCPQATFIMFSGARAFVCVYEEWGCLFASLRLNTYPVSFSRSGHGHNKAIAGSTD